MKIHASIQGRRFCTAVSLLAGLILVLVPSGSNERLVLAQAGQSGSTSTLRVNVDLVTVEVVALDKKGNPIPGLKKEDFKLYEDGKQQQIVSFDIVSDKTEPQVVPTSLSDIDDDARRGKVVLILFDDSTITPSQTKVTRDAAEKYVKEHMRSWDLFSVAVYGMSLKVTQNFTHDSGKVVEAIRIPAMSQANLVPGQRLSRDSQNPSAIPGQEGRPNRRDPFGQNPGMMQEARFRATQMFRSLGFIASSLSRVKGRKSILMFSEDFAITGESQNELRQAVTAAQRSNVVFYSIDARGLNSLTEPGARSSQSFLGMPKSFASKKAAGNGLRWKSLVSRILPVTDLLNPSASGLLGASFLQQTGGGQTPGQGGQGGGQGSPGGSTGAGGGQGGTSGGGLGGSSKDSGRSNDSTSGRQPGETNSRDGRQNPQGDDSRGQFDQFQQQAIFENVLRSMATETGGLAIFNTNNLNQGLDKVDLELSNYYVLGFNPGNPKRDGKFRKLEVKTDVKGTKLKYRNGYQDPRPLDALAGSKGERSLMSAISSPTPLSQLPVNFHSIYFYDSPELARVPISAKIKKGIIELKKKGPLLVNSIDIMGVAYAEDGSVAARFSETMNLAVEKDKEELFRNQDIPYRNYLKLRPGKYQIKLAVADEKGKVGTAEQSLVVPPISPAGPSSSSLVVTQQMTQLPDLIRNLQTRLLDESDPLIYKGLQILPQVENTVNRENPVAVFYKLYNLTSNEQERKLTAVVQLVDEKGKSDPMPSFPIDDLVFPTGRNEVAIGLNLPVKDLAPGKYRVIIETTDTTKNQKVSSQTEIVVQ